MNKDVIENFNTIYLEGKSNTGKTTNVLKILKYNDYDYIHCYLQKLKNENDFLQLLNRQNIINSFYKKKKKKIIVIDNIDYLQNNDKKILNIIIKFIKSKEYIHKYKNIHFIFIGINNNDKRVLELIKLVKKHILIHNTTDIDYDRNIKETIKDFVEKKINIKKKSINDKTIISLCYHENIINYINNNKFFYEEFLNNFCNGDYFDRLSFQKQLWQFNEMTFYLKVLYNYYLYKNIINNNNHNNNNHNNNEIIFTKILTKYSNEYSNMNFIKNICFRLNIQKEELYFNFILKENKYDNISLIEEKRIIKLLS